MKHYLTGAFVLAAITAPLAAQAEGKIYGQFNVSLNEVDGVYNSVSSSNGFDGAGASQNGQSGDNNASRLGFQGENGQFFYAVELGLSVDDSASGLAQTRHAFVGANTSVGTFTFGRTNSAYKLAAQRLDPFYDTSAVNFAGVAANEGGSYGLSNLANGWTNNSIAYITPEVGGLTINAGIYLQEQSDEDHDFGIGLDYRLADLEVGVQYIAIGADNTDGVVAGSGADLDTAIQATASYGNEAWSVGVSYEMLDARGNGLDVNNLFVAGDFAINENLKIAASVGQVDDGISEGLGYTVGAFVELIKDFTFYGLYSSSDLDNSAASETDVISLGVRYGFQI
ncbi:MAG: porin [Oceanococcus sp.]